MKNLETLERYLKAQAQLGSRHRPAPASRHHPFVTISRQAGAGGHALADALLEVFGEQPDQDVFGGWQVFDREVCEMVAADPHFAGFKDSLLAEEYRRRTNDFVHQILHSTMDQDIVMNEVFKVIRAVASAGKAIILGRGASEVTRDEPLGVAIRLVAPESVRLGGVMSYYGLGERQARAEAEELDASRARLLRVKFGVDIDDPERYDAVWNSGRVPVRFVAGSVVELIRERLRAARDSVESVMP